MTKPKAKVQAKSQKQLRREAAMAELGLTEADLITASRRATKVKMVLVFDTDDTDGCKSSLKIMKQLARGLQLRRHHGKHG